MCGKLPCHQSSSSSDLIRTSACFSQNLHSSLSSCHRYRWRPSLFVEDAQLVAACTSTIIHGRSYVSAHPIGPGASIPRGQRRTAEGAESSSGRGRCYRGHSTPAQVGYGGGEGGELDRRIGEFMKRYEFLIIFTCSPRIPRPRDVSSVALPIGKCATPPYGKPNAIPEGSAIALLNSKSPTQPDGRPNALPIENLSPYQM